MAYDWLVRIGAVLAVLAGAWLHGWKTRDVSCQLDTANKTLEVVDVRSEADNSVKRLPDGESMRVLRHEWKR